MRRYGIVLMTFVLAFTSLIASAAQTSVDTSLGAFAVSATSGDVVLQLTPQAGHLGNPYGWDSSYLGPGNADENAYLVGDKLVFDFSKGFTGGLGMQPNSAYTWNSLFLVRNILGRAVDCTVKASFPDLPAGIDFLIKDSDGTEWVSASSDQKVRKILAPSIGTGPNELYVDFKIAIGHGVGLGSVAGSVIVTGVFADPPEPPPGPPEKTGTLTVHVVKSDGASVAGLPVRITGAIEATIFTDENGVATLSNLAYGEYIVNTGAEGYSSDGPVGVQLTADTLLVTALITLTPAQSPPEPPRPPEPQGPIVGPPIPPGNLPKTGVGSVIAAGLGLVLVAVGRHMQRRIRRRRDFHSGRLLR